MCGITGWVSFHQDARTQAPVIEAMTATLAPRGPDGGGVWLGRRAAIGHRRLAVIDLAGGAQPMTDRPEAPAHVLTYSGEIYNHHELRAELRRLGHEPLPATATEAGTLPDPVPLTGCPYKSNPYPLYEQMRETGPVHRVLFPSGVQAWLVTGYDAAHSALNDDRLGKNHDRGNDRWRARASIMPEPQHCELQVHLLHQDPPKHTRMRRFVTDAFTPRRIEQLRPRFQELADILVAALPETGPTDLVTGFAAHFPFQVLADFTGSRSALQRECRKRAYGVIQRSRAWGALIAEHHPRAVRLSIHPQPVGAAKFGIRLLDAPDARTTPWHSAALRHTDGTWTLMPRAGAEQLGRLVHHDGRPSHFEQG